MGAFCRFYSLERVGREPRGPSLWGKDSPAIFREEEEISEGKLWVSLLKSEARFDVLPGEQKNKSCAAGTAFVFNN